MPLSTHPLASSIKSIGSIFKQLQTVDEFDQHLGPWLSLRCLGQRARRKLRPHPPQREDVTGAVGMNRLRWDFGRGDGQQQFGMLGITDWFSKIGTDLDLDSILES